MSAGLLPDAPPALQASPPTDDPVAPLVPPSVPRRRAPLLRAIGRVGLRLYGWRVENAPPDLARQVCVVAPHTSNWDFLVGLLTMAALDLRPRWLGKHTIFRPPVGAFFRALGGIPVRRSGGGASAHEGSVGAILEEMAREPAVFLTLAPEGTRGKTARWKSGYHVIAQAAGVPITPSWIDWSRRVVGFGAPVSSDGPLEEVEARLRAAFTREMARRPDAY